jgi:DNA repair protein RadD
MAKILRTYQLACVEALFSYIILHQVCSVLLVCPVGSGKTLIIAEIVKRILSEYARTRILILTSTRELLVQNAEELREHIPNVDFGFYCAALGEKKLHNDITLASIQSIYKKAISFNRAPQVLIIDESHTVSHDEDTLYRSFIKDLKELNPNLVIIGLTGTPWRMNSGRLDEGEGKLFDDVAYEISIAWLIENGYLCRPTTRPTETHFDLTNVGTRNGDYIQGQLEKAVDVDSTTKACVDEIIKYGHDRKKWLIFCAGIEHAQHVTQEIQSRGIFCDIIIGETEKEKRNNIVEQFRDGRIKCLVNVATMTTGINIVDIDMIALLRPTRSKILYLQMLGRGLRTAEGKENLLVLDFGQVVETLGAIDTLEVRKKFTVKDANEEKGRAITKICPSCGTTCAAAQKYCYECSYCFLTESLDKSFDKKSALLSSDIEPETFTVWSVGYYIHHKKDDSEAPPTMRVSYATDGGSFSEWIPFESPKDGGKKMAAKWHMERLPLFPIPKTVIEAVVLPYPKPETITIRREGKYNRVIEHGFPDGMEPVKPENYQFEGAEEIDLNDDIPF